MGHELRRPEANFLGDGIYELRAAVVSQGLVKQRVAPSKELDHAVERKKQVWRRIRRSTQ